MCNVVPVESLTYLPRNIDKNKTASKTQRSNAKNPFFSHKTKHICKSTWNRKLVDLCWAFFSERVFVFRFRLTFFFLARGRYRCFSGIACLVNNECAGSLDILANCSVIFCYSGLI